MTASTPFASSHRASSTVVAEENILDPMAFTRASNVELEALPVPFDDGLRFDDDQDLPPILPELREAPRRIDLADAVAAGELSG